MWGWGGAAEIFLPIPPPRWLEMGEHLRTRYVAFLTSPSLSCSIWVLGLPACKGSAVHHDAFFVRVVVEGGLSAMPC